MATLKVVDQRDRPAEAVAGTLSRPLLFDDAQEALYVFVGARLSRHAADGTWATAPDSWSYTDTLAFAPDGTLRGTGCRSGLWGTSLNAFDPDSLGGTSGPSLGGQCWEWDLAYGGDGVALLAPSSGSYPCMSYSQGAGALKPLPSTVQCGVGTGVVASTDGRRVVFGGAPGAGAVEYDPATGTFRQVMGAAPGKVVAIDRTGSRVVVADGTVYDRDWRTVARIDVLYAWPFALTPDGSKVVLWDQYSPLGKGAVRVFDVSSPEAPELGPEGGTVPAVDIGVALSIAVSADGRTAFLGGSAGYAVFPLP
jgi:hypothetical protein